MNTPRNIHDHGGEPNPPGRLGLEKPGKLSGAVTYLIEEPVGIAGDIDLSLLEENLRLSLWERMLANDDALNSGESLRAAMKRHNAES